MLTRRHVIALAEFLFIEILAGDVCFVNLFRSILPVVPTEFDVLIVCRQHNDKEWKFKEQHAKMWENTVGAKSYSSPRGFNIAGASASAVPTSLKATKPVFILHCSTFLLVGECMLMLC